MITPEEIRKGLRACTNDAYGCSKRCPYFNALSNGVDCATNMHNDALAYINQLEADNASKQKRIDELEARLAQVEKENAALLHDLKTADQECLFCKRNKFPDENCCCECGECQTPCACFSCKDNQYYLWSGVSEKNTKEA